MHVTAGHQCRLCVQVFCDACTLLRYRGHPARTHRAVLRLKFLVYVAGPGERVCDGCFLRHVGPPLPDVKEPGQS